MLQNQIVEEGNNCNLKLTTSNDQVPQLSKSCSPQQNSKMSVRKVISLQGNETGIKRQSRNDIKAFNAKLNTFTNMEKEFVNACNKLYMSYEAIKKFPTVLRPEIYNLDLDTTVKNIIEKKFGIKYPKSYNLPKRKIEDFIFNVNMPPTISYTNSTTNNQKLDFVIKDIFDDLLNFVLEISQTNMKYHFWIKNIIQPNIFCDLNDIKEHLVQHIFNKEQLTEQLEISKLNKFSNNLQIKFKCLINEIDQILKPKEFIPEEQNLECELRDLKKRTVMKFQTIFDDKKQEMDVKIKMLETENERIKTKESENVKQIQFLVEELAFQNKKLINIKDRLLLIKKEKKDLIHTIKNIEIKDQDFQILQNKFEKERKKNNKLKNIIKKGNVKLHDINLF